MNRHLQPGSTGWNAALAPSDTGIPVCRASNCDLDAHARPADSGYEIGAYEGTGTRGFSSTCQNVAPGQCLGAAAALATPAPVTIEVTASSQCPGEPAGVSIALAGSDGTLRGAQLDLLYDPAVFEVGKEQPACTVAMGGYPGEVYAAVVTDPPAPAGLERLRVILFDLAGAKLADGPLAECAFGVRADAAPGAYPLLVDDLMVAGPGGAVDAMVGDAKMEVLADCAGEEPVGE